MNKKNYMLWRLSSKIIEIKRSFFSVVYSLLPGLIAFSFILGWDKVLPTNFVWLLKGDMGSQFLGWLFYKNALWQFPVGQFDTWLVPFGTSITLTDGIPLIAIPAKLLKGFAPSVYQYFGLWLLFSFVLMSNYAFRLCRELNGSNLQSILVSLMFTFSPVLCFRLNHVALTSQWLILSPLLQAIRLQHGHQIQNRDSIELFTVSVLSLLIQPYLFTMVFPLVLVVLFLSWNQFRTLEKSRFFFKSIYYCSMGVTLLLLLMGLFWTVGYGHSVRQLASSDFGSFSADLLSFINSMGHSAFLPRLRTSWGQYEGFAYLGLGQILFLTIFHGYRLYCSSQGNIRTSKTFTFNKLWWLTTGLMAIFALSGNVRLGGNDVLDLNWFWSRLSPIPDLFRSSGRFIWPLYYSIMTVTAKHLLSLGEKSRHSLIVALVAVIQIGDIFPSLKAISSSWTRPLPPIYNLLTAQHRATSATNILMYPPLVYYSSHGCKGANWSEEEFFGIALFAAEMGLKLNSGFSARIPSEHTTQICDSENENSSKALVISLADKSKKFTSNTCYRQERYLICDRK